MYIFCQTFTLESNLHTLKQLLQTSILQIFWDYNSPNSESKSVSPNTSGGTQRRDSISWKLPSIKKKKHNPLQTSRVVYVQIWRSVKYSTFHFFLNLWGSFSLWQIDVLTFQQSGECHISIADRPSFKALWCQITLSVGKLWKRWWGFWHKCYW